MVNDVISVNHVSKKFKNKQALDDINLTIQPNKIYGFSGPNGSGKSVLFKTILGFIKPTTGEVVVENKVIRKDTTFAENIGFSMQEYGLLPDKTGLENIELLSLIDSESALTTAELLKYVGLDPTITQKVKDYSLGMNQRLLIAAALVGNHDILIFDEPSNALDDDGQQFLIQLLSDLKSKGKTILLSSHDGVFLENVSDHIFKMRDGKLIEA